MGSLHVGILFILGIGVFGGILGGILFQRFKIPQVIGYIVIGIIIGRTGFKIIDAQVIETFKVFNYFALGVIGFLVGGELFIGTLKKYGKQFSGILLGEGILAFVLVTTMTTAVLYLVSGNLIEAIAVGLVFGAVSSATDPASTIDVLWEYRAAGVLTTTLIAIVALDDALAMTLYGISKGLSQILIGGDAAFGLEILSVLKEIFGAVALGAAGGGILFLLLRYSKNRDRVMAFAIGIILLVISLAQMLGMDIIFASMTMGLVIRNLAPNRSKGLLELFRSFSQPIYIFFFVLVGARLTISDMPGWLWLVVGLYCIGRNAGKILGAKIGGKITRADKKVQNYTGLGLFAQGGVAIGLAIIAGQHLSNITLSSGISLGDAVIFAITTTTLIFQITGPPMVKLALRLSDEMGKNLTKEDLIAERKVNDQMIRDIVTIDEALPMVKILTILGENDFILYPVINDQKQFQGIISFENIKNLITNQDIWQWILAKDLSTDPAVVFTAETELEDALETMRQTGQEQVLVLDNGTIPIGVLDLHKVERELEREIVTLKGNV